MVSIMERECIQIAILPMQRKTVKATVPELIMEIHMYDTDGQGAYGLCHCLLCASKVSLHHQIMLRLACFLLQFYPTSSVIYVNHPVG
jgi:hypothetical protein